MSRFFPIKSYETGSPDIPSSDAEKKDKSWYKNWGMAIMRLWRQGGAGTSYGFINEVDNLRAYAIGNQDVEKYKEATCLKDPKTGERKSFANISWDNVNVMHKTQEAVVNSLMANDYDISMVALDETAIGQKLSKKYMMMVESKLKPLYESIGQEMPEVPDTLEQLDLMVRTGGIKLSIEMAAELLFRKTLNDSNWDNKVKRRLLEDMFAIGTACVKDRVDPTSQEVYCDYVDPKYLILPYSRDNTYSDCQFIGHIDFVSEQQLRRELQEDGVPHEKIKDIITRARTGESSYGYSDEFLQQSPIETRYRMDTGIPVLRAEFRDTVKEQMVKRKKKDGTIVTHKERYNPKAKNTDKRTFHKRERAVMKTMSMVLGEDLVFKCGDKTDVAYKDKMPMFSYHVYKTTSKSKVEQCISVIDDMQLAVLRMRTSQANAMPDGHAWDFDAISQITMGGRVWDPMELMTLARHTGNIVFKGSLHKSQGGGRINMPITPTNGGTGKYYEEQVGIIERSLLFITEVTGFNEFMTASNTQGDVAVGNQKQLMDSSSNILRTQLSGYKSIKEELAESVVKRWQVISMNNELTVHEDSVGAGVVEVMKVSDEFPMHTLGISAQMRPSESAINTIMEAAYASIQAARQGGIGISFSDFMFIKRTLDSGNVKLAGLVMAQREEIARQRHEEAMRQNQEASQLAGIELEKEKQKTLSLQKEADLIALQTKGQIETNKALTLETLKGKNTIKSIDRKGHYDLKIADRKEKGKS